MMNRHWHLVMVVAMLTGCELLEHRHHHDPHLQLDFIQEEDFSMKSSQIPLETDGSANEAQDEIPETMETPISLTVTPKLTLSEVFQELSFLAQVDIALDPEIRKEHGGLVYRAQDKPFIQIVDDICRLANLRFEIKEGLLFIEPDIPYSHTYSVDALSQLRASENSISISSDVFSVVGDQNRAENGSNSLLKSSGASDFWGELEANLKILLNHSKSSLDQPSSFSFHKQAGLVTVFATTAEHQTIQSYLSKLEKNIGTQVLIEAKIIEVNLHDEFRSGINWSILGNIIKLGAPMGSLSAPGLFDLSQGFHRDTFTFSVDHKDFGSVVNLVKKFGKVRTLSNPRLTVMNNQPAMLKVATNEVFFQLEFDRYFQADGKPDVESFSSHIMTVPIGLVLVVQPAINYQTGEITMTLRPTVSRIEGFVEDPAVAIKSNQKVTSRIPVVQVREIDSVLKLKTGEVLVLGGLMENRSHHETSSVPFIEKIPLIGDLLRGEDDERKVTELVIFLTASIHRDF